MGAAMGWPSSDVKASSLWEFFAAWDGFVRANSPKEGAKLSESEADELFDWMDASPAGARELSTPIYNFDDAGRLVPAGVVTFILAEGASLG